MNMEILNAKLRLIKYGDPVKNNAMPSYFNRRGCLMEVIGRKDTILSLDAMQTPQGWKLGTIFEGKVQIGRTKELLGLLKAVGHESDLEAKSLDL